MNPSNCSLIEPLLGAYLDGELSSETAESLALHLHKCLSCRGLLERLAETDRLLRGVRPDFPTEHEWAQVEQRLLSRARTRALRYVLRAAACAAAAVLLLGALVWAVTLIDKGRDRAEPAGGGVTYQNGAADDAEESPLKIAIERG